MYVKDAAAKLDIAEEAECLTQPSHMQHYDRIKSIAADSSLTDLYNYLYICESDGRLIAICGKLVLSVAV